MRNAFAKAITELAAKDKSIVLLSGDIGNRLFNDYKQAASDRFYNCGVAEGNMTGMAAGLALAGLRPVTYTITSFNTTRCFEQIRVDVCYQNLPVVIVGVGSGLAYSALGATHHSCEDIAIMRSLPNMTVICPGDPVEVRLAIKAALKEPGPVYIRLGKKGEPVLHKTEPDFKIGKSIVMQKGKDICILATGSVLSIAMDTADKLAAESSLSTEVVSLHTIKPLDSAYLKKAAAKFKLIVTLEEHSKIGGLGSAIGEWLADSGILSLPLLRFNTGDAFLKKAGSQVQARESLGLSSANITEKIAHVLTNNQNG